MSLHNRLDHLSRRLHSVEYELWFLTIVAMVLDVTLTVHGLQIGLQELNPVARSALQTAGVFGLYGLKMGALAVGLCCRPLVSDTVGVFVPVMLGVPSLVAATINATLIASQMF